MHRDWIVVEVDSRRMIESVIDHEVSNKIDDGGYQSDSQSPAKHPLVKTGN